MSYLNSKDVYDLFENGVAHLHVTDIDQLPKAESISDIGIYKWEAELDNGAVIRDKTGIVFAHNADCVPGIVKDILCKSNEDFVTNLKIKRIEIAHGDGFVIDK